MMIERKEVGIHTLQMTANNLTYSQIQKVMDLMSKAPGSWIVRQDSFGVNRTMYDHTFGYGGVQILGRQSYNKSNSLAFIINPRSLLLNEYEPTGLYVPSKKSWKRVGENMEKIMKVIGLSEHGKLLRTFEDLSVTEIDMTTNLWFQEKIYLREIVRIFRKGNLPRYYKAVKKKPTYFVCATKDSAFKVYDKVEELKNSNCCPKRLYDDHILRLEVSLRREALLRKLPLKRKDSSFQFVDTAYMNAEEMIYRFADQLDPVRARHYKFPDAVSKIQRFVRDKDLADRMILLLKLTSKSGLSSAIQEYRKQKGVDERAIKKLLDKFDAYGVNPITLRKNGDCNDLPTWRYWDKT